MVFFNNFTVFKYVKDKYTQLPIFQKMLLTCLTGPPLWWMYERRDAVKQRYQARRAVTEKVYMDFAIGDKYAGRVLIGLYGNDVPLTCENFVQLCRGFKVGDKMIGYQNTLFHQVINGICIIGGDSMMGNGQSLGMSIYGPNFPDENFNMRFVQDGDLAMVNNGPNTNASQFMITLCPAPVLDGKNVVFGTVVKGMRVIRDIGEQGMRGGRPLMPVRVLGAGTFDEDDPPPLPVGLAKANTPRLSEDEYFDLREGRLKGGASELEMAVSKEVGGSAGVSSPGTNFNSPQM